MCVLEGCDGAGKSTIAERMRAALSLHGDAKVLHKGPMIADAITEYEVPLEDYVPATDHHVICDRWHVGELVYGPLLRGESRVREFERRHIDKFLAARGAIICHVVIGEEQIRRRIGERGDDLVHEAQIPTIIDSYYDVLSSVHWVTPMFDMVMTGEESLDRETISDVIRVAVEHEARARMLPGFGTYVGEPNPRILLLGERRNLAKSADMRAAFVPKASTSGEYLFRALPPDVNANCGLANACEEDIGLLWQTLGQPYVVALGRDAARECEMAEIPYGQVPHPAWVRRFKHDRLEEYGRMIREAAYHRRDMTGVFA